MWWAKFKKQFEKEECYDTDSLPPSYDDVQSSDTWRKRYQQLQEDYRRQGQLFEEERDRLLETIEELRTTRVSGELVTTPSSFDSKRNALLQQISDLELERCELQKKLEEVESDLATAKRTTTHFKKVFQEACDDNEKLSKRLKKLKEQCLRLEEQIKEEDDVSKDLMIQKTDLEKKFEGEKVLVLKWWDYADTLMKEKLKLEEKKRTLETDHEKMEQELAVLKQWRSYSKQELDKYSRLKSKLYSLYEHLCMVDFTKRRYVNVSIMFGSLLSSKDELCSTFDVVLEEKPVLKKLVFQCCLVSIQQEPSLVPMFGNLKL